MVLGLEADIEGTRFKGSDSAVSLIFNNFASPNRTAKTADLSLDYFGTVRGRLGYDFNGWLVYGTGGFAYGHASLDYTSNFLLGGATVTSVSTGTASEMHTGWTAGAGIEYAINPHWSVKAEWLHVDLGTEDYPAVGTTTVVATGAQSPFNGDGFRSHLTFDAFKAGANYRF